MPYVSFISAPDCLAAAAGLVTPLRTCPVDRVAPSLGLRYGQAPKARPLAPKLPQPPVDLVHFSCTRYGDVDEVSEALGWR